MATKRYVFWALILSAMVLSACAQQPLPPASTDAPGFLLGLWHGFTSLFSFIGSLFTDIRVYAFPNNGGWYDFGFVIGAAIFYGGAGGRTSIHFSINGHRWSRNSTQNVPRTSDR